MMFFYGVILTAGTIASRELLPYGKDWAIGVWIAIALLVGRSLGCK